MQFNSIMHVAFYTEHLDEMLDFYVNKLGLRKKAEVKYGIYLDRPDRPALQKIAQIDPERVFYIYLEIAPGQFLELFPPQEGQKPHTGWNECLGYSHFGLLVEDIFQTREQLRQVGITPDTEISLGPSGTYKMWLHDPDGNKFEVMQYTEDSLQLKGNC
jgi:catechol 2,3-dioxygenase-like lactoylglutathione lyase family enzyme